MRKFFKTENWHIWSSKYKKLGIAIAVVVVFATTYALILPALTLDSQTADKTAGLNVAPPSSNVTSSSLSDLTAPLASSQESAPSSQEDSQTLESTTETNDGKPLITEDTVMTEKGSDYEVTVAFGATAQLPQGVELKVSEIVPSTETYQSRYEKAKEALGVSKLTYARFFDILFVHDNQEVEPAAPVSVKIKTDNAVQMPKDSQMKVVHFEDDNNVQLVDAQTDEKNNQVSEVSFDANSFSDYGTVLADYYTVNFVYKDSEENEQTISTLVDKASGSKLGTLPESPFREGYVFSHWINKETGEIVDENTTITGNMTVEAVFNNINIYTITVEYYYHNNSQNKDVTIDKETVQLEKSDTPYQITPPASTEVSNKEDTSLASDAIYYPEQSILEYKADDLEALDNADGVDDNKISQRIQYVPYTAEYDFVYMLKDLTGSGYSEIQTVRARGILGSTVTPKILTYKYADYEKSDTVKIEQASGQKLYVYYTRKTFNLSYNSNGGSNIDSQSALYGSKLAVTTTTPQKEGYTFAGWYDNPELTGNPITGSITLKENTTLYAKWTPNTVNYTIAYYKEVYDNDTRTTSYVYDSSRTSQGKVGTTVQATNSTIGAPPSQTTIKEGYEKDNDKNTSSSIEIAADGTSVLKVYYKLIRYTFVFDLNNSNGRITMNGQTYSGTQYRITNVVLGQDISSNWPSSTSNPKEVYYSSGGYNFDLWSPNFKTKRYEVTSDMLPASGTTRVYTASWTRYSTQNSVEYWLQQSDGSYQKSDKYSQSFIKSGTLNPKDIYGYSYYTNQSFMAGNTIYYGTSGSTYRFYYKRSSYNIDYYYGSDKIATKSDILFDSNINTSTYNYQPSRPSGVDEDYTWGGWYADSLLTEKYTFNKMPANNLPLYAKWIAPTFTVSFDTAGASSATPTNQTVKKYKYATAPTDPTRDHYNFLGWYTSDGKRFEWDKKITSDIKLTAKWELKPLTYTVKYLEKGSDTRLAADKEITSPSLTVGQNITEKPLAITGYRPEVTASTIQLDYDNNTIIFYYTPRAAEVDYTIRYVLADNPAIEVAPTVTKTVDGSVIRAKESATKVDKDHMKTQTGVTADMLGTDYYPIENTQSLVLTSNAANNVITFKYASYDTKAITVNYLDMDGNPIDGQEALTTYHKKSSTYVLDHKTVDGYTYDHSEDSDKARDKVVYKISDGGNLTIDLYYKKNITLKASDKSKIYDGTELKSSGLSDLISDYSNYLKSGDKLDTIVYDGGQVNAGISGTTPKQARIVDEAGKDHTDYYKVTYVDGILTVSPLKVTVTIDGDKIEKVYNAIPETITYKISNISNSLYKESDIVFNGSDSDKVITQKDAGTYNLSISNRFSNENTNFDVNFEVSDGSLIIKPRKVTLTSASDTKAYDGQALTNKVVNPSQTTADEGFVFGEGMTYDVTGSQTAPGSSANTFTYTADINTKVQNYDITIVNGDLTVTPTINLQKTTPNWSALAGGKFEISKWDGISWAAISGVGELAIASADAGVNIPVGLTAGRYRIKETAAPDGYIVLDSYLYFTVTEATDTSGNKIFTVALSDENGTAISSYTKAQLTAAAGGYSNRIQIANEAGKALPSTGGSGKYVFIIAGITLMVIALLGSLWMNHNRERSGQS
ncbi:InlB B-repeat-containing protein [Streptococcus orisratti]|uniref:InlB B-repeat-containing protein n=1 Tax=Streptococcus orisratti TaxID=114652 RepID=UPI00037B0962|nr:InlB B-repeat-containing protein [Streptococcus orisratti]